MRAGHLLESDPRLVPCRHRHEMGKRERYYNWMARWVGVGRHAASCMWLPALLYTLQLAASSVTMATWVMRTYSREMAHPTLDGLEFAACCYVMFFYAYNWLRYGSNALFIWTAGPLVDVYTCFPVFAKVLFQCGQHGEVSMCIERSWLDLGYLRAYRMLQGYTRISGTGILDHLSEMRRESILFGMRTITLTVCFAGTIFVCEVLGDFPGMPEPSTITTGVHYVCASHCFSLDITHPVTFDAGMGQISFYQMCYWIFVTISTVGYGDYAPTTILSRTFTILFILGGVVFFSGESNRILEVYLNSKGGMGSYTRKAHVRQHVIVTGGACSRVTEPLVAFLREIVHHEHVSAATLEVVVMNPAHLSREMITLLKEDWANGQIQYLCGSILTRSGRNRIRLNEAAMAFVLTDTSAANPEQEDLDNIMRAVGLSRNNPRLPISLMLIQPSSIRTAVNAGLRASMCCSLNFLKMNLLAQSCRCPGYGILLANLVGSVRLSGSNPLKELERQSGSNKSFLKAVGAVETKWPVQYLYGEEYELRGFEISEDFDGEKFVDLFLKFYFKYDVLVLGVQEQGSVHLFPPGRITGGAVVYAVAKDDGAVLPLSKQAKQILRAETCLTRGVKYCCENLAESFCGRESEDDESATDISMLEPQEDAAAEDEMVEHLFNYMPKAKASMDSAAQLMSQFDILGQQDQEERLTPEKIAKAGGHIVVIGTSSHLWQVVETFLGALRAKQIKNMVPIIVVTEEEAPFQLKQSFEKTAFVKAQKVSQLSVLEECGVAEASRVVLVQSRCDRENLEDRKMADTNLVVVANTIEKFLHKTRGRVFSDDNFCIYELQDLDSALLLPNIEFNSNEGEVEFGTQTAANDEHYLKEEVDIKYHLRQVNGSLMASNNLTSLWAWAYYAPGMIQTFLALIKPPKHSTTMPWRPKIPRHLVGSTYGALLRRLATGEPTTAAADPSTESHMEPALALGLFRGPGVAGSPSGFVFAGPPGTTVLQEGDSVFVLASPAFGDSMIDENGTLLLDEEKEEVPLKPQAGPLVSEEPAIAVICKPDSHEIPAPRAEEARDSLSRYKDIAVKLFERYDFDGSGTINSENEMRQLTTNMIFYSEVEPEIANKISLQLERIVNIKNALRDSPASKKLSKLPMIEAGWDIDQFAEWYHSAVHSQ